MSIKTINRILVIASIAAIVFAATLIASPHFDRFVKVSETPERIEEDDPRWDCQTMGNKVCGPTEEQAARFAERNCPIGFVAVAAPEYAESGAMECVR